MLLSITTDVFGHALCAVTERLRCAAAIAAGCLLACATPAGQLATHDHSPRTSSQSTTHAQPIPLATAQPHAWSNHELTRLIAMQTALHAATRATTVAEPNSAGPLLCDWSALNESTPRLTPRPDHPATQTDILLIGSSTLAWALRPSLEAAAAQFGWSLHNSARPSTSLARPDYFDWPSNLPRTIVRHRPRVVVMQFGGNDCQALRHADGSNEARRRPPGPWRTGYTNRVFTMVRIARDLGARVLLLDLQSGRQAPHNHCIQEISKLLHQVALAADIPIHSVYNDTCDGQRGYREHMHVNGALRPIRSTDGLHLNTGGGTLAGRAVLRRLRQHDLLDNSPGDLCRNVTSTPRAFPYPFDQGENQVSDGHVEP